MTVEVPWPVPVRKRLPAIASVWEGDVVPRPTLPWESMMSAVVVPKGAVVVDTRRIGAVEVPRTERVARGEVVPPKPRNPEEASVNMVVDALGPVEEAMVMKGVWERWSDPPMERRAVGEDVPMPRRP